MTYPTDTVTIQELFYKQMRELTHRTTLKTLDAFNQQFSGRCFL